MTLVLNILGSRVVLLQCEPLMNECHVPKIVMGLRLGGIIDGDGYLLPSWPSWIPHHSILPKEWFIIVLENMPDWKVSHEASLPH